MIRGKYREKILLESSEEAANRPSSIWQYSAVQAWLRGFTVNFHGSVLFSLSHKSQGRVLNKKIGPFILEKISHGLLWPLLTEDANTPYKWYKIYVHGFLKPRLILAWEFILL